MSGGTTIRDVVIRIRMELANNKLPPPDLSAWKGSVSGGGGGFPGLPAGASLYAPASASPVPPASAGGNDPLADLKAQFAQAGADIDRLVQEQREMEEAAKAAKQAAIDEAKAYDQLAKDALSAYAKIMREREQSAKKAEKQYDDEAKAAMSAYSRIMAERERNATQQQKLAEKTAAYVARLDPTGGNVIYNSAARSMQAQQRLEQATLQNLAAQKQQMEVFSGLGEAAIRAARGIAFVTAANEEELKAAMKWVAAGQGVSDMLIGSINLYKQLAAARYAAAAAAKAQAAADVAAAAAGQASASASAKALTVVGSLHPALRVVGVVAAAAAAGMLLFRQKSQETAEQLPDLERRLHRATESSRAFADQWQMITASMSLKQQMPGFDATGSGGEALLRQLRTEQENRRAYLPLFEQQTGAFGGGAIGQARVQQQLADEGLESARIELSLQQQIAKEREQQRRTAEGQLNLAKQTVEAEKNRLQSDKERFGRLNPGEQERLKDIARRRAAGKEITKQEALFEEQAGFGGDDTNSVFSKQADQAGFGEFAENRGRNKGFEQAKRDLVAVQNSTGLALQELTESVVESEQAIQQGIDRVAAAMRETFVTKSVVARLEEQIQELSRNQKNGNLYSRPAGGVSGI